MTTLTIGKMSRYRNHCPLHHPKAQFLELSWLWQKRLDSGPRDEDGVLVRGGKIEPDLKMNPLNGVASG